MMIDNYTFAREDSS